MGAYGVACYPCTFLVAPGCIDHRLYDIPGLKGRSADPHNRALFTVPPRAALTHAERLIISPDRPNRKQRANIIHLAFHVDPPIKMVVLCVPSIPSH